MRGNYPWREHHLGLTLTHTELKMDGISVVDTNGENTTEHSDRDETVLVNLFQDKLFELGEQYARGMNGLLWGDGTVDAKALAGMRFLISADPSVGIVGGLDQSLAANAWWRNRARTTAFGIKVGGTPALGGHGGDSITSDPANGGALITMLQTEYRQLIRYGGKPTMALCGSDFIGAMEIEVRANGNYSMTGFSNSRDVAVGELIVHGHHVPVRPDPRRPRPVEALLLVRPEENLPGADDRRMAEGPHAGASGEPVRPLQVDHVNWADGRDSAQLLPCD